MTSNPARDKIKFFQTDVMALGFALVFAIAPPYFQHLVSVRQWQSDHVSVQVCVGHASDCINWSMLMHGLVTEFFQYFNAFFGSTRLKYVENNPGFLCNPSDMTPCGGGSIPGL
jgi:hypothetical protein